MNGGLLSLPDVKVLGFSDLGAQASYVVIASDGLWEFMSSSAVAQVVEASIGNRSKDPTCQRRHSIGEHKGKATIQTEALEQLQLRRTKSCGEQDTLAEDVTVPVECMSLCA